MGKKRELYWTNTTAGHNKDYMVIVDFDTYEVTSIWGPIGGHHSSRIQKHVTLHEALTTMRGKRTRRIERGYRQEYDKTFETDVEPVFVDEAPAAELPPIKYARRGDFTKDLYEMKQAEVHAMHVLRRRSEI
jgi:hypothetical protein